MKLNPLWSWPERAWFFILMPAMVVLIGFGECSAHRRPVSKYPSNVAVIELTASGWQVRQLPPKTEAIEDMFKTMCTLTTKGFTNVNGQLIVQP